MNTDFTFDGNAVISALGLDNSKDEVKKVVLEQLRATLEQRVGLRMQEELDETQMQTFLDLAQKSETEAKQYLQEQVPRYRDIYQEELNGLIDRLRRNAEVMVQAAEKSAE